MVLIGAGGHAIEVIEVLSHLSSLNDLVVFDNAAPEKSLLKNLFPIISSWDELATHFNRDSEFIIAIGTPSSRKNLSKRCSQLGGNLTSIISHTSIVGEFNVILESGLNIMHNVIITGDVIIGEGTLLNAGVSVHHNVRVGEYCEISPGARLLGGCVIGNECSVGSGAIILPGVNLGNNVVVGAGAVVTKDVANNLKVAGVPAKSH
jgi:sugar O-acyltransferase (sialic acid O-acetyltransferase NeuD family)